jgi:hypothetical protein
MRASQRDVDDAAMLGLFLQPTQVKSGLERRLHEIGLQAFRDCQTKALDAQAAVRSALKVQQDEAASGQQELFTSMHDMGPSDAAAMSNGAKRAAEAMVPELTPKAPRISSTRSYGRSCW